LFYSLSFSLIAAFSSVKVKKVTVSSNWGTKRYLNMNNLIGKISSLARNRLGNTQATFGVVKTNMRKNLDTIRIILIPPL